MTARDIDTGTGDLLASLEEGLINPNSEPAGGAQRHVARHGGCPRQPACLV
jgi:hypothetical protein